MNTLEEWLDNLWEIADEVVRAYKDGDYTHEQYIEERQNAIDESKRQIKAYMLEVYDASEGVEHTFTKEVQKL